MKRDYLKPTIRVVKMQHRPLLQDGSPLNPEPGGGESRGFRGDWDDVEE